MLGPTPGLLPGPGNQAAGRIVIVSYFHGFLILKSEQVAAPTVSRVRRWRIAGGLMDVHMYAHVRICICVCIYMYMCVHVYTHVYVSCE